MATWELYRALAHPPTVAETEFEKQFWDNYLWKIWNREPNGIKRGKLEENKKWEEKKREVAKPIPAPTSLGPCEPNLCHCPTELGWAPSNTTLSIANIVCPLGISLSEIINWGKNNDYSRKKKNHRKCREENYGSANPSLVKKMFLILERTKGNIFYRKLQSYTKTWHNNPQQTSITISWWPS